MSMSVLVQLGVGIATPYSILQVKKPLIRHMEQNAGIKSASQTGHYKFYQLKGGEISLLGLHVFRQRGKSLGRKKRSRCVEGVPR